MAANAAPNIDDLTLASIRVSFPCKSQAVTVKSGLESRVKCFLGNNMSDLTIGRAAKAAGVKIDTIRYYQRIGLITEPTLPQGGQRKYGDDVIRRIKFIKRSQVLGFTLAETRNLLSFEQAHNCWDTKELAERKIKEIDHRIADLRRMRKTLSDLAKGCDAGGDPSPCPIIDSLALT